MTVAPAAGFSCTMDAGHHGHKMCDCSHHAAHDKDEAIPQHGCGHVATEAWPSVVQSQSGSDCCTIATDSRDVGQEATFAPSVKNERVLTTLLFRSPPVRAELARASVYETSDSDLSNIAPLFILHSALLR